MVNGSMPVLPEDILVDIFSRLSGKIVCKFKCLSKSWLSLISSKSSEFKTLHRLRANQRPPLLVLADAVSDRSSPGLVIEHDTNPLGRRVVFNFKLRSRNYLEDEFVSSCGDLMCFYNDRVVYVYSPSTSQYLRYDTNVSDEFRVSLVYVASMNLYKVVKLDVKLEVVKRFRSSRLTVFLRFEALTVQEEEYDDEPPGGEQCGSGSSSWELISEHVMPSGLSGKLGNFIGVNGVVYVTIKLLDFPQPLVLSLGLDDNSKQKFATVSLPHDASSCRDCTTTNNLCQVKDLLCFPHTYTSSIDLWLLEDRYTSTWFKGYTISCIPPSPHGILRHLVYFPHDVAAGTDADGGDGLLLFVFGDGLFHHDIRKEATRLLQDWYTPRKIHVFSDNLYSLKNGLRFTRMPANAHSPDGKGKTDPWMIEGLVPGIPTMALTEVVSRLSAKDACKLKVLSKAWLSFISSNPEFKRLHHLQARHRPSFLVLANVINDYSSPCLSIEDTHPLPDYGGRKVVFNFDRTLDFREFSQERVSSCRDLMCFGNDRVICIYSPSTNQYLRFDTLVCCQQARKWRLGLVYVASMKLYKVIKLEVDDSFPAHTTVRFEALTVVPEEEDEPQFGGRGRCDVDKHQEDTPSWEFISEHAMDPCLTGTLGNLLGLNGVVYSIITHDGFEQRPVLSLGFEEEEEDNRFKIFSLPQAACDGGNCDGCRMQDNLFPVKGLVCFPHPTTSSIDLWLLKDRRTCIWFKGYTISYIRRPCCHLQQLAYFPHPTTTISDDEEDGDGILLYLVGDDLFQYDIRTKEPTFLSRDKCMLGLHVFSDNLYPLKDGLSCPRTPAIIDPPERKWGKVITHPPQPRLPRFLRKRSSLKSIEPPQPYYYLRNMQPPAYSLVLKTREPHHPAPQGSLPPPPYLYEKVYWPDPLPPLGLPPPPPRPFNPDDFEYMSPEVKKRKVHLSTCH